MKQLDLCVVADRFCPTSRTYLTYLKQAGLVVHKVLLVDFVGHQPSLAVWQARYGRIIGGYLKQKFKLPAQRYADEFQQVCQLLQRSQPIQINYFGQFDFAAYCKRLDTITAVDFDDTDLHRRLLREQSVALLYTNGGRIPQHLLRALPAKVLHIHPGVVPAVRGSDGLLWSVLMRGKPGATCFYMNAGIDTGDVIATREFPLPQWPELAAWVERNPDLVYRALLHAYDPHLRAQVLLDALRLIGSDGRIDRLPARAQDSSEGRNFYWMHPRMYPLALAKLTGFTR